MAPQNNNQDPYSTPATYEINVGGKILTITDPEPTGGFMMQEAGIDSKLFYLVQVVNGQLAFAVDTNDNIDAALPGLEYLQPVSREGHYLFRINNHRHVLTSPITTGRKLLALEDKPPERYRLDQILLTGEGSTIDPDDEVDLSKPGIERFITVPKEEICQITIIVNGQKKTVSVRMLSYTNVVNLAYNDTPPTGPNIVFAVTYKRGPESNPEGTMSEGLSVEIKEGMIFNVTATDKS